MEEVFTLPWNIGNEAERIQNEEYGEYADPFSGDYRHFINFQRHMNQMYVMKLFTRTNKPGEQDF